MDGFAVEQSRLSELRSQIDEALLSLLREPEADCPRLGEAMRYALLTPGKRVRPILALLSAEHLGCPAHRAMHGACALEMIHSASLVFDDLPCMDDAKTRRGQPSVHVRFGQDVAVLTGVALLNQAFEVVAEASGVGAAARLRMVSLLARTVGCRGLVSGQLGDLDGQRGRSRAGISDLHYEKTGVLFVASVEMGALAADVEGESVEALRV